MIKKLLIAKLVMVATSLFFIPIAFASSCSLSWDGSHVFLTDSGHDIPAISGQSWAYKEAANGSDSTGNTLNSGTAHGTDDYDFSNPVSSIQLPYSGALSRADASIGNSGGAYSGWVMFHIFTSPTFTNDRMCWVNTASSPPPPPSTFTASSTNTYIFLITSYALFLFQLFVILMIFFIVTGLLAWPIRKLVQAFTKIIKRGGK